MSLTSGQTSGLGVLKRDRLIDRAVDAIKDYILSNHLEGGARLPSEQELAASFGVSRNVVRQAVSSLETLGIVRVAHGRGIYVADVADTGVFRQLAQWLEIEDLTNEDFIEARTIFERGIYELLMERVSDADLTRLESLAQQMHEAADDNEVHRLHSVFHQTALAATGNRFLVTVGSILNRFFWSLGYTGEHVHRVDASCLRESHVKVVELLRGRCPEDIPRMITLHLGQTEE